MKVTATYRNIWSISYPIILGSLATTVLNLTDTAFIARVGETELGAMAITSVFYFVIVMIGISLGIGSQIIMSRRAGEGDVVEIGKVFDHSIILLSLIALVSFTFTYFYSPWFFKLILSSDNIISASNDYMGTRSFGLIISMVTIAFRSFYIGISQTRIITYSAIIMLVLNVILDYLLIFGNFGFPEMGIKGAALASVISELTAFVYLVGYSALKHEFKHFRLMRFGDFQMKRMRAIINLSSPVILQNVLSMSSWFMFFVLIEHMGERELAISNIIRATYMVLMTPIWGFASATNSMVSNMIGQNKVSEVKSLVGKIITLSLITTLGVFLVSFISPYWMLKIITSDITLIQDSLGSYAIVLGAMFLFSISVILLSTVSGSGNTRAAMVIEFINIFIYVIYVYLCTIVFHAAIEVVWFSEIIYWVMMGLLSYIYLTFRKWEPVNV